MDNTAARRECFADGRLLIKVRKGDKKDGDRFNVMEKELAAQCNFSRRSKCGRPLALAPSRPTTTDDWKPDLVSQSHRH